jgi:enoyl-[acyl-carrier-protein] reductase (NADH)
LDTVPCFLFSGTARGITEEIHAKITSKSIQQRMLDPIEIAHMAVYLASDEAKGVTGQAMNVDGGAVLW